MSGASQNFAPSGGQFNTLAQKGTGENGKPSIVVMGQGSPIDDVEVLERRSKCKAITLPLVFALMRRAYELGNKEMEQAYRNTYYCLHQIYTTDGKLYGKYCKNRFCTLCSGIRKARMINSYLPIIETWEDPHFVTLTIKSITAKNLKKWMDRMPKAFHRIYNRNKKRFHRGTGVKLIGIKSLECNFNPKKRWYNPHFHLIVPSKEVAELLRSEWIKEWRGYAGWKSQSIRRVSDPNKDLIEILKYSTKIFTEFDVNRGAKNKGQLKVYAAAIHNIFMAMQGHRLFSSFGFTLSERKPQPERKEVHNYEIWEYQPENAAYVNIETDEPLFEYQLEAKTAHLLENCIDRELE